MQAIYQLRTLADMHMLDPMQYKITIEAKTPEAFYRAESAIRHEMVRQPYAVDDPRKLDGLFRGQPFEIMGIPIEFKAPPVPQPRFYQPRTDCECWDCQQSRARRR